MVGVCVCDRGRERERERRIESFTYCVLLFHVIDQVWSGWVAVIHSTNNINSLSIYLMRRPLGEQSTGLVLSCINLRSTLNTIYYSIKSLTATLLSFVKLCKGFCKGVPSWFITSIELCVCVLFENFITLLGHYGTLPHQ